MNGLRKRMAAAHPKAGVKAATCFGVGDKAVTCSGVGIEDDRWFLG
jgi:hypothetical protein